MSEKPFQKNLHTLLTINVSDLTLDELKMHISQLQQYIEDDPEDLKALGVLEKILLHQGNELELIAFFEKKIDGHLKLSEDEYLRIVLSLTELYQKNKLFDLQIMLLEKAHKKMPHHQGILVSIQKYYQQNKNYEKLVVFLKKEIYLLSNVEQRSFLWKKIADISYDNHAIEQFIEAIENIYMEDKIDQEIMNKIENIYYSEKDFNNKKKIFPIIYSCYKKSADYQATIKLVEEYIYPVEIKKELINESELIDFLKEIVDFKINEKEDYDSSFYDLIHLIKLNVSDRNNFEKIEKVVEKNKFYEKLLDCYLGVFQETTNELLRNYIQNRIIYFLDKTNNQEKIIDFVSQSGKNNFPKDHATFFIVEKVWRQYKKEKELLPMLLAMVPFLNNNIYQDKRNEIFLEISNIYFNLFNDYEKAKYYLNEILEKDPYHIEALRRMLDLEKNKENDKEIIDVLDKLINLDHKNNNLEKDFMVQAEMYEKNNNTLQAIQCIKKLLHKYKSSSEAIKFLEKISEKEKYFLDISKILDPIYEQYNKHYELVHLLNRKIKFIDDLSIRKSLWKRIIDLYAIKLHDPYQAFAKAKEALYEDLFDMSLRITLDQLAQDHHFFDDLAYTYADIADKIDDEDSSFLDEKINFLKKSASLYEEIVQHPEKSIEQYKKIITINPQDEKSLGALERIYKKIENWNELINILILKLNNTSESNKKIEILESLLIVYTNEKNIEKSLDVLNELVKLLPHHENYIEQIISILEHKENWQDLEHFLKKEFTYFYIENPDNLLNNKINIFHKYANVLHRNNNGNSIVEVFKSVIKTKNDPFIKESFELLASFFDENNLFLMAICELYFTFFKRWDDLIDLNYNKIKILSDPEEIKKTYYKIYEININLVNNVTEAISVLGEILFYSPYETDVYYQMEKLAEQHNLYDYFCEVVSKYFDNVLDDKFKKKYCLRLSDIYYNKIGNIDKSIEYLKKYLILEPFDEKIMYSLICYLEKVKNWPDLTIALHNYLDILNKKTEQSTEIISEKKQIIYQLAKLYEKDENNSKNAKDYYLKVLEYDENNIESMLSLIGIYRNEKDIDNLLVVLNKIASLSRDTSLKISIHKELASIYTDHFSDNNHAIEQWKIIFQLDPLDPQAIENLPVLLTVEEKWQDLVDFYQEQLSGDLLASEQIEINQKLGTILSEKLLKNKESLDYWKKVVEKDPQQIDPKKNLLKIYHNLSMWDEYVELLRNILSSLDPKESLVYRLDLIRVLALYLNKINEVDAIIRDVCADPCVSLDDILKLVDIFKAKNFFKQAIFSLHHAALLVDEDPKKIVIYTEEIDLIFKLTNSYDDALETLQSIFNIDPGSTFSYGKLEEYYFRNSHWNELIELHKKHIEFVPFELKKDFLVKIKEIEEHKIFSKEMAFISSVKICQIDPLDEKNIEDLLRLSLDIDALEDALDVINEKLEEVVSLNNKIKIYQKMSEASLRVERLENARLYLEKCLEIDPSDLAVYDKFISICQQEERYDIELNALCRKILYCNHPEEKKEILFQSAKLAENELEDPKMAMSFLESILEWEPCSELAFSEIIRICELNDFTTDLLHVLQKKIDILKDTVESIPYRLRLASLFENDFEDLPSAISLYKSVLAIDDNHELSYVSLERIYSYLENWSDLLYLYQKMISSKKELNGDDKITVLTKMAYIHDAFFLNDEETASCYEKIIEINPSHMPTMVLQRRIYRKMKSWLKLVSSLEHYIDIVKKNINLMEKKIASEVSSEVDDGNDENKSPFIDLKKDLFQSYMEMGDVYYKEIYLVDQAEKAYQEAFNCQPDNVDVLKKLGQLYERSGNWFQALDMLKAEVSITNNKENLISLHMRIEKINENVLADFDDAKRSCLRVLEIDPMHESALSSMKNISKIKEDWLSYEDYLSREIDVTESIFHKIDLLLEMSRYLIYVKKEEDLSIDYFENILLINSYHEESLRNLGDIYFRKNIWDKAKEKYELLTEIISKTKDPKDYSQKYYRLGLIYQHMQDTEKALVCYEKSYEALPIFLPVLEKMSKILFKKEDWLAADKIYQTILVHHAGSLDDKEKAQFLTDQGLIYFHLEQFEKCHRCFYDAWSLETSDIQLIRYLLEMDEKLEYWQDFVEHAKSYTTSLTTDNFSEEQLSLLMKASGIAYDKLSDAQQALWFLEQCYQRYPKSVDLLSKMIYYYVESGKIQKAINHLMASVELFDNAKEKAKLIYQMAVIYDEQLKNINMALKKYRDALELDPTFFRAFERIEKILSEKGDWLSLEEYYQFMIEKNKKSPVQVRLILWKILAELYCNVLRKYKEGIDAYEMLHSLQPEELSYMKILAKLYTKVPGYNDKAVLMRHLLLAKKEEPLEHLSALLDIYQETRDFDAMFYLISSLMLLDKATVEQKKMYNHLNKSLIFKSEKILNEDDWLDILGADILNPIGVLCDHLVRLCPDFIFQPLSHFSLKKHELIDMKTSELYVANILKYLSQTLHVSLPDCYRKSDLADGIQLLPSSPAALLIAEQHPIFREIPQRVAMYYLCYYLTSSRSEILLPHLLTIYDLQDMLFGLCLAYNQSLSHHGQANQVMQWLRIFQKMPTHILKRLQMPAKQAYDHLIDKESLNNYMLASQKIPLKMALLMCGDLLTASKVATEMIHLQKPLLAVREQISELVLFSVSKQHFNLRKKLGLAIKESVPS